MHQMCRQYDALSGLRRKLWSLLGAVILTLAVMLMAGPALGAGASAGPEGGQGTNATAGQEYNDVMAELGADYGESAGTSIADPLEPWNRLMFQVNDKLYFWLFKPVARGYAATLPQPWRESFGRAFDNIGTPVRLVNDILQGHPIRASQELGSFVINTLFGFGGLLDPAQDIEALKPAPPDTDTGLTLGTWGIGHGIYLVWPVIGPCSLRDSAGKVGDAFLDPIQYVSPWELSAGLKAEERLNGLSMHLGEYEDIKDSALDPYTAFKDGYIQYRKKALHK